MRVPLPPSLASRSTRAELTAKLAQYENEAKQLTEDIITLKGQILSARAIAEKIPPLILRDKALATGIADLRRQLAALDLPE